MKNADGSGSAGSLRLVVSQHDLPFTTVTLSYDGRAMDIPWVLIDTGSATTVLSTDLVSEVGIEPLPNDRLRTLRGVGGIESVFTRKVDRLQVGGTAVEDCEIEVGGMDYGFEINGVLGMNFLRRTGAVIDLREMTIAFLS